MRSQKNCCMPAELRIYMSKPIKALRKARDLYVKKLEQCAAKVSCGGPFCCAVSVVPHHSCLPRSISKGYVKLKNRDRFQVAHVKEGSKERRSPTPAGASVLEPQGSQNAGLMRSAGLGYLGRIVEDKPYCFEEDFMHFRSRSQGIAMTTKFGFFDV